MSAQAEPNKVAIFGIRHHGPGSARSLRIALEQMNPDIILLEGPEEAATVTSWVCHVDMKPPVALLIYDPSEPSRCAFYPFAEFSPEWQAMVFASKNEIPLRFMDLPARHLLGFMKAAADAEPANAESETADDGVDDSQAKADKTDVETFDPHQDPLSLLARAAGFDDTERWWDWQVEHRGGDAGLFQAVAQAIHALREELGDPPGSLGDRERIREAWMRGVIRGALKEGFQRIAVVCGAWHVPALENLPPAKHDAALLKDLPRVKVEVTWAPWSYRHLASSSGYAAGVVSPGWYEHLWESMAESGDASRVATRWLARTAALLRDRDYDVSPGHLIEAVRLVDALCAMRDRPLPGLEELREATLSVLLNGDSTPLALIHSGLVIGNRLGAVPRDVGAVPLQIDLERQQKGLRLKAAADHKDIDLDLRASLDLARSHLLHRLRILEIPWGRIISSAVRSRGTFRETWRIQWTPELAVSVITASVWGTSVRSAAGSRALDQSGKSDDLANLTELINDLLLADLGEVLPGVVEDLEARAAVASDVAQLMNAIPALAQAARYGNVRRTDTTRLDHILDAMIARVCIGLSGACASLDDDAATAMCDRIMSVDAGILLCESQEQIAQWRQALRGLLDSTGLHALVAGRVCRMLFDVGVMDADETHRQMSLALSRAADPIRAGCWVEGFAGDSAALLIHSGTLLAIIDSWLCSLSDDAFIDVLPVLRRTFCNFSAPERRQIGELLDSKNGPAGASALAQRESDVDIERAAAVLPLLRLILAPGPQNDARELVAAETHGGGEQ